MQSILELFSQKLIIHQFHLAKSARLHRSHLYSNSVNTGTILSQKSIIHQHLFSKSARLHRSYLYSNAINTGTIKLEVIIHQFHLAKCKVAQESLIQQLNQHWNYLRQKSIIHQFPFSKSARLHRSHLYSNSINTGTI